LLCINQGVLADLGLGQRRYELLAISCANAACFFIEEDKRLGGQRYGARLGLRLRELKEF
jgi:hypothetical protein